MNVDDALSLMPPNHTICLYSDGNNKWYSEIREIGVGTHITWPPRYPQDAGHDTPEAAILSAISRGST